MLHATLIRILYKDLSFLIVNVTLGIFNPIHGFLGIFHRLRHFSIVSA